MNFYLTDSSVRLLVTFPLFVLATTFWLWFSEKIFFNWKQKSFSVILLFLYFSIPLNPLFSGIKETQPKELPLDQFSLEKTRQFDFFSAYTLSTWIMFFLCLVLLVHSYLRGSLRHLSLLFAIIVNSLIGIFNNGINSAYTWSPSWRNPWTVYTYGNGTSGVVNSDEPVHRALTVLFTEGRLENLMLIRRAFPYFLAGPLGLLTNNLLAFQILNMIFVIVLLIVTKRLLEIVLGKKSHRLMILCLVASYPQIVFYQYQSSGYLIGIALTSLALLITLYILISGIKGNNYNILIAILVLSALSYDTILTGTIVASVLFAKKIITKRDIAVILFCSTFPGFIYEFFVEIVTKTEVSRANSGQIFSVMNNLVSLLKDPNFYLINSRIQDGISGFISTNGLIVGSSLLFIVLLTYLIFWKRKYYIDLQLRLFAMIVLVSNLTAHLIWNLGGGWQFNIPRLTAGPGLFLIITFVILLSRRAKGVSFFVVWMDIQSIQILVLLPDLFNTHDLTWISVTGGY